jgi:hypothetical protein
VLLLPVALLLAVLQPLLLGLQARAGPVQARPEYLLRQWLLQLGAAASNSLLCLPAQRLRLHLLLLLRQQPTMRAACWTPMRW